MDKTFVRNVLKLMPAFSVADDHYLFELPVVHVLAGFAWDKPPRGLRVWKYALPLYEGAGFHFGYGDLLPKGDDIIAVAESLSRIELAEEFVRRISPYRSDISKLRSLESFLEYQISRDLGNPVIRRCLAMTFIMTGDLDNARKQLDLCLRAWDNKDFKKSVYYLLTAISDGTALKILLDNELQMIRDLQIPHANTGASNIMKE